MKSLLTSVVWPAWEWGPKGLPHLRYLGTSHKETLSTRDNLKARRLIKSEWFQRRWSVPMIGDQDAKTKFENVFTGFRESMAFTSMTGSRGDRVILDDPHSVDDANSQVKLASDVRTFREALPSRVNSDDSAIVIIMQRLNEADISQVAIDLGYDHLCLPMRYEPGRSKWRVGRGDPRTIDGELMFPERFPEEQVAGLERTMGSYAVAGQLQQRPAPRGGGMFKREWFEIIPAAPANCTWVRAWDFAASTEDTSAWTAGLKMGRTPGGEFVIADVRRIQGAPAAVERLLINTAQQDGHEVTGSIPQDPGQAGKSQVAYFIKQLAGFTYHASPETGDKETRASPLAAQAEVGNVKLVKGDWNEAFLDEIAMFPVGRFKDQVDAASRAFAALLEATNYTLEGIF